MRLIVGSGQQTELLQLGSEGAAVEVVVAVALDHVKDAPIQVQRRLHREPGGGCQQRDALGGLRVVGAGPRDLELHQADVLRGHLAAKQLVFAHAEGAQVFLGQIYASAFEVLA